MSRAVDATELALAFQEIRDWWDELHGERVRGTPRRWAEQQGDPAPGYARVAPLPETHDCGRVWSWTNDTPPRPYCAQCTRHTVVRGTQVPVRGIGESPSPGRLDVTAIIADAVPAVLDLEDEVRENLGDGPRIDPRQARDAAVRARTELAYATYGMPDSNQLDPRLISELRATVHPDRPDPRVPAALTYLARQADRISKHPDLAEHADTEVRRLRGALRRAVGTAVRIRQLHAACPICGSVSLRAFLDRDVIACINPACRCNLEDCQCQQGRRHMWRYDPREEHDEWAWLAQVLDIDLAAELGVA